MKAYKRRYRVVAEVNTDDPKVAHAAEDAFKAVCEIVAAPHGVKVLTQTSDSITERTHMERPWGE